MSSDIQPLSLAIEPGSSPAFVSDDTATATAGTPFDFGVRTASCPAINDYTLQGTDAATSSWLTINNETGELSGTPTAAAAGTIPSPSTPPRPAAPYRSASRSR